MPVHFDLDRLERVIDAHERWWNGTLDRPLVSVTVPDAYDVPAHAAAPLLSQKTCFWISMTTRTRSGACAGRFRTRGMRHMTISPVCLRPSAPFPTGQVL